jgi:triphosphatase
MEVGNLEIETKIMLPDAGGLERTPAALAAAGAEVRPGHVVLIHDTYLDTDDWWFFRAGLACRIRRQSDQDGRTENWLTLKQLADAREGVAMRLELEERLGRGPRGPIRRLPGRGLGLRLRRALAGRAVRELFNIDNRRTTFRVQRGKLRAEAAADAVQFRAAGKVLIQAEVELESRSGRPGKLAELADDLARRLLPRARASHRRSRGKTPVPQSKFRTGLQLAGLKPPELATLDFLKLSPRASADESARRIVGVLVEQMAWHESGVRLGLLAEPLHQMRVTSRRLRAALRAFRGVLGRADADVARARLAELTELLGRVRDLDVYLQNLPDLARPIGGMDRPVMVRYRRRLTRRYRAARAELLTCLDGGGYRRLIAQLRGLAKPQTAGRGTAGGVETGGGDTLAFAREMLANRYRKTIRFGRDIAGQRTDAQLHRLRLMLKRLRYTCEFVQSLLGRRVSRQIPRIVEVQDALGRLQDAITGEALLAEFARSLPRGGKSAADMRADVATLLARLRRMQKRARRQFVRLWPELARRKVRKRLGKSG